MEVADSRPGVAVEASSRVVPIVGVPTSVALFIGRAKRGPLFTPVQCLSIEDFNRCFSGTFAGSELARSVRLFFANGGRQCHVMRIARDARAARVVLRSEEGRDTLGVQARAAGVLGDEVRLVVSYDTALPESTFNLEVFRWATLASGARHKTAVETFRALSMDPQHPRYAPGILNPASRLVRLMDLGGPPAAQSWSRSGRAVPAATEAVLRRHWRELIGVQSSRNRFRLSVNGCPPVDVDLSSLDFDDTAHPLSLATSGRVREHLEARIRLLIDALLPEGLAVEVRLEEGPCGVPGQDDARTVQLCIASRQGDVLIQPAHVGDVAAALALGTAHGGQEVSRWACRRPAPSGLVTARDGVAFAGGLPEDFRQVGVQGAQVDLGDLLGDPGCTGRERLWRMAERINAQRAHQGRWPVAAEVWGDRLALLPAAGDDDLVVHVVVPASRPVASPWAGAVSNVRHYSLGGAGRGAYQGEGTAGHDGQAPQPADYETAYEIVDRELDLFNLLVLPPDSGLDSAQRQALWGPASAFCRRRRAFLLIDPPEEWADPRQAIAPRQGVATLREGMARDHAAVFCPRLLMEEHGQDVHVGPAGAMAGLMARIDASRGVWKAPAGVEADLRGITGVEMHLSDSVNASLNPRGINTLRVFSHGIVSWGARTLDGDDASDSAYKYIPVRRLALFLEESLARGLKWAACEPPGEPLCTRVRLSVEAFLHGLFRQGAFQGATPREAYAVSCGTVTTSAHERTQGRIRLVVGFAPLRAGEFVTLELVQPAGQPRPEATKRP